MGASFDENLDAICNADNVVQGISKEEIQRYREKYLEKLWKLTEDVEQLYRELVKIVPHTSARHFLTDVMHYSIYFLEGNNESLLPFDPYREIRNDPPLPFHLDKYNISSSYSYPTNLDDHMKRRDCLLDALHCFLGEEKEKERREKINELEKITGIYHRTINVAHTLMISEENGGVTLELRGDISTSVNGADELLFRLPILIRYNSPNYPQKNDAIIYNPHKVYPDSDRDINLWLYYAESDYLNKHGSFTEAEAVDMLSAPTETTANDKAPKKGGGLHALLDLIAQSDDRVRATPEFKSYMATETERVRRRWNEITNRTVENLILYEIATEAGTAVPIAYLPLLHLSLVKGRLNSMLLGVKERGKAFEEGLEVD